MIADGESVVMNRPVIFRLIIRRVPRHRNIDFPARERPVVLSNPESEMTIDPGGARKSRHSDYIPPALGAPRQWPIGSMDPPQSQPKILSNGS